MKTTVIYHKADFDGIFCREIARKFLPNAELIGWNYGDKEPEVPTDAQLYILDLSVPGLMSHPNLVWIDHHKSAIDKYSSSIPGYRIDGVAACRLTWQWFTHNGDSSKLPDKEKYVERYMAEPFAVRLAGEYDIWDKRDPKAELFQHGLRSQKLTTDDWQELLSDSTILADQLLAGGLVIQCFQETQNESVIKSAGFDLKWEGLTFLACNSVRYNSLLFVAGEQPHHDALLGFSWRKDKWSISLYHKSTNRDLDLSVIAVKHGGGGHRGACGFTCKELPFKLE